MTLDDDSAILTRPPSLPGSRFLVSLAESQHLSGPNLPRPRCFTAGASNSKAKRASGRSEGVILTWALERRFAAGHKPSAANDCERHYAPVQVQFIQ
jgi:hypothetical protein